jgi:hypothetical protein
MEKFRSSFFAKKVEYDIWVNVTKCGCLWLAHTKINVAIFSAAFWNLQACGE